MSWSQAKWVVDQLLQKTGNSPNNMRAFTAFAMSKTSIGLKFLEPADSYDGAGNLICAVGGVMIRKSTEGFPASVSEGDLVINNTNLGGFENTPLEVTGLVAGQTYYFSAFPYSTQGVFNLSSSGANRAEGVPADGEQAIVSITIDDASGFTSAVVTCVDETDPSATQTVALTPSKTTHTFTIPIGDKYHIEFGAVTDYFKPNNTASKVSVAGETSEYTGAYSYFTSTINVTYPTGSTCTCTCGDVSYTAPTTTGSCQFKVHKAGTWLVKATNGSETAETPVVITDTGESKTITLAYFTATIGVTYPVGAKLTCSCNGRVYEAEDTSGSYTFTVHATGTWAIKAELDGEIAQTTVSITKDGQSESVTLAFFRSTIAVTYPAGATLTCSCDGETLTATSTTGTYTFEVRKAGTWKVKAVDGSLSAETDVAITASGQSKTATLSFFTSTINVTYPTGSTCTCTCGDVSYTAPTTTGSCQFKVHKAGTWLVKATNGSETAETPVVITDTGESKTITLAYFTATIGVTYPVGAKLTCSCNGRVYEAEDTSGSYTFTVHATGTWAIKAELDGEIAQTTVSITKDGQSESVTLAFFRSTIAVTYPAGATLTCSCDGETLTATSTTGTYTFEVRKAGTWKVKAVDGSLSAETDVAITASGQSKTATLSFFTAYIKVTYPAGATCTCTKGSSTMTASGTSGSYTFTVHETGTYTLKATLNGETTQSTASITADGQTVNVALAFVKIYGISRTVANSSTAWARTDDAVGMTATASVGTTAGKSSFDNCYPWSAMKRETLSTGDVMVKIPEFWFERKVTNGVETIRIADKAVAGFVKHPGSGKYVGAYKTSSNNKSVKGAAPTVSQTRATMRTNAKSKGSGWGLIDVATNSAIQMLYLVEFADNDSQKTLGRGYCDGNSAAINSGSCDSVPNLTGRPAGTDGKVDVVYRGIEGIFGNIWEWMDGLNYNGDTDNYYVCTDPSKYADDTATGYTKVSFTSPTSNAYISKEGMDNALPWAMLPSEATGGSETTFYPDYFYQNSGWRDAIRSGVWSYGSACGVWILHCRNSSSDTGGGVGSRLLYDPS